MNYDKELRTMMVLAATTNTLGEFGNAMVDVLARMTAGLPDPERRRAAIADVAAVLTSESEVYRKMIDEPRALFNEPCDDPDCPVHGGTRH